MSRADRLFQLVQLLRGRRLVTGQVLAGELGVSVRTVYRDIHDLVSSGVPVRGEAGVGYSLDARADLPPMTFTPDELEALVLGARIVGVWGDKELSSAAKAALVKIQAVLPPAMRPRVGDTALYAPNLWAARQNGQLGPLRRAVAERRKVQLDYKNAEGIPTMRVVRPLGLFFWGAKWSLAAFCELRGAYRNFRVDRVARAEVLDLEFDGTDGIDLDAYTASVRAQR